MNLQNIPRSLKEVKTGFIPKFDNFLFFDYSNIELRILAYYLAIALDDWSMADEFTNGIDIHVTTALGLYGKVTDDLRQDAKVFTFSQVYGGGAPTLIRQGVAKDMTDARALMKKFHETRPGIKLLSKQVVARYDKRGFIETPWGSRLHPMDDHKALNVLIQGCAADLMRHGLRACSAYLRDNHLTSQIVNVVHDEIMFDVVRREVLRLVTNIPACMDYEPISAVVPIKSSIEIAHANWADKRDYEGELG